MKNLLILCAFLLVASCEEKNSSSAEKEDLHITYTHNRNLGSWWEMREYEDVEHGVRCYVVFAGSPVTGAISCLPMK